MGYKSMMDESKIYEENLWVVTLVTIEETTMDLLLKGAKSKMAIVVEGVENGKFFLGYYSVDFSQKEKKSVSDNNSSFFKSLSIKVDSIEIRDSHEIDFDSLSLEVLKHGQKPKKSSMAEVKLVDEMIKSIKEDKKRLEKNEMIDCIWEKSSTSWCTSKLNLAGIALNDIINPKPTVLCHIL